MELEELLKIMVQKGASDLFITTGIPPSIKVHGKIVPVTTTKLSPEKTRETVFGVMTDAQKREFASSRECNFAISARGIGRFRVSAYYQRNLVAMVLRRIEVNIPKLDDLSLPPIIKELSMTKRGIIIFVGATGTGKSTSLAAMIGHRNHNSFGHIICIEDPIEFIHQHASCIVTQREVGIDTESFEVALKNTLRQAPDVIMIGEIRTREAMDHAIAFSETGHLVLATLHANNANQALDRIIHFFPSDRHSQLWMDLSLNLRGIVAQQLIPTPDGKSRRAAIEVLVNTPLASDMIRKGEVHNLKELMKKSRELGMQTFDQALFDLYISGQITYEHALSHADSPNDLRLMIKLESNPGAEDGESIDEAGNDANNPLSDMGSGFSLEQEEPPPIKRR
ncbi:MAG: PilT/PilU family type 4a pilus ATPase [Gammaproteobacteria bacterium]|nr:PilT/PilU family type 4a pilus ATPase [Gammaproteobacteria bacterium]